MVKRYGRQIGGLPKHNLSLGVGVGRSGRSEEGPQVASPFMRCLPDYKGPFAAASLANNIVMFARLLPEEPEGPLLPAPSLFLFARFARPRLKPKISPFARLGPATSTRTTCLAEINIHNPQIRYIGAFSRLAEFPYMYLHFILLLYTNGNK